MESVLFGEIRGWRVGSRINESCARRGEAGRGGWNARKPARNVIFRQMCGHEREIIAPARSSWSSVRKCGRIVIVAGTRSLARSLTLVGMIVTEGQSQGRRNLAEDGWMTDYVIRLREKSTFSFSALGESRANGILTGKIRVLYIKRVIEILTLNNLKNLETRDVMI